SLSTSASQSYVHLPALHSFPTRRSSDLLSWRGSAAGAREPVVSWRTWFVVGVLVLAALGAAMPLRRLDERRSELLRTGRLGGPRSGEHTSELQALTKLLCRLLLVKKNIK